jgi:hypothetical protein
MSEYAFNLINTGINGKKPGLLYHSMAINFAEETTTKPHK